MKFSTIVPAFAILALVACDNNPGKDKAHANVSEPGAATTSQPAGASVKYVFSGDGSKIAFVGAKLTGKHEGGFATFTGSLQLVDGNLEKSSVSVEIDIASMTTDTEKLSGHLKSADFFDVGKFAKAKFTSTSIRAGGDKGATHTVTGNLELHGVTKSISFPATIRTGADGVTVDAEFAVNRKDFGLVYPGMPDDLIKDDVLVRLTIRSKKG